MKINALHPFVATFSADFQNFEHSLPLELFSMAEILLESELFSLEFSETEINSILDERDQVLRYLAKSSGQRSTLMVAEDLRSARNDQNLLEVEVVAAFNKLGFDAVRIGGAGKPDGTATAHLSGDIHGKARRYIVSLEAKSTTRDGKKIAAQTVSIAGIIRHREDFQCRHAVVVGPDFPTRQMGKSHDKIPALIKEINSDRDKYKGSPDDEKRTITLMKINDLAALVVLAPLKHLGPSRLRELFLKCISPQDVSEWINNILKEKTEKRPYKEILKVIWGEQQATPNARVEYGVLRVKLRDGSPSIKKDNNELKELCRVMANLAPAYVTALENTVELDVNPSKILEAINVAMDQYPTDDHLRKLLARW
ncbi:MAG: hypothetical protein IH856_21855 [Deltaproteobacteria bacterium]|nr:hypothetical protein [Deltaproteobacteria bacterium]